MRQKKYLPSDVSTNSEMSSPGWDNCFISANASPPMVWTGTKTTGVPDGLTTALDM